MPYTITATSRTPALVIYLLDTSASMASGEMDGSRIELVMNALRKILIRMIQRSTKGTLVSPRYRLAMFAYGDEVYDLLGGIRSVDYVAKIGLPQLVPQGKTNTAAAFSAAEKLLNNELPTLQDCPAPLVCHMTDGEYSGENPLPYANRIMELSVPDGNMLVENIFIGESLLTEPIRNITSWSGLTSEQELKSAYAKKLFQMSSKIPQSYRSVMREMGYQLATDARMMLPAMNPEILDLGFAMSGATPVSR